MNRTTRFLPLCALALLVACGGDEPAGGANASGPSPDEGLVREAIHSGGYTFLRTVRLGREVWVRAPQVAVSEGDRVELPEGMPQHDFRAESLDRTFDLIYIVSGVRVMRDGGGAMPGMPPHGGGTPTLPDGHPPMPGQPSAPQPGFGENPDKSRPAVAEIDLSGVEKAEDGYTIAELYDARADLKDQVVKVRGRVVKFTPQVMNRNWVHIRDGSGEAGTNDLTFTTTGTYAVGDTVLVTGSLTVDRDFGFGYRYDLIIEDADAVQE